MQVESLPVAADARQRAVQALRTIHAILRDERGVLPAGRTAANVRASIGALSIVDGAASASAAKVDTSWLFPHLKASAIQLRQLLDFRLEQLAWNFPRPQDLSERNRPMNKTTFFLRDELLRQIDQSTSILQDVAAANAGPPDDWKLLREADAGIARHLDSARIEEVLKILGDERSKVESLEFRILFTGVLKAGKTTSINALIGRNILPTRTEPSTTLPTLVKCNMDREEPQLTVRCAHRLNLFLDLLAQTDIKSIPTLRGGPLEVYGQIVAGWRLPTAPVRGLESVRSHLSALNDALRIAELVEQGDEMLAAFESSEDLPVVEVAFASAAGLTDPSEIGRLVLVDSPGPNEARHSKRLRSIVASQLQRCSALVIVANYEAQGANDESDLEAIISEYLPSVTPATKRMLLLNRYNNAALSSRAPEETIREITLRFPQLTADRIFLVGARLAELAGSIRHCMEVDHCLPEGDLAKEAVWLAYRRRFDAQDPQYREAATWKKTADDLWDSSFFDTVPIDPSMFRSPESGEATPVVRLREAAQHAATFCIEAGLGRVGEFNALTRRFLDIRSSLNDEQRIGLEDEKRALEADITELAEQKKELDDDIASIREALRGHVRERVQELKTYAEQQVDRALHRNEQVRAAQAEAVQEPRQKSLFSKVSGFLHGSRRSNRAGSSDHPHNPGEFPLLQLAGLEKSRVTFGTTRESTKFMNSIDGEFRKFVKGLCESCEREVKGSIATISSALRDRIEVGLGATLQKAADRLGRSFDGALVVEDFALDTSQVDASTIHVGVDTTTTSRTEWVEVEGTWADFKRGSAFFFNDLLDTELKWGMTSRVVHDVEVSISRDALSEEFNRLFVAYQTLLEKQANEYIDACVDVPLQAYFRKVVDYLESYKNDISDVIRDHGLNVEQRQRLRAIVVALRSRTEQLLEDIREATLLLQNQRVIPT